VSSGGVADSATIFNAGSETVRAHGTDLTRQISDGKLIILVGETTVGPIALRRRGRGFGGRHHDCDDILGSGGLLQTDPISA
jgi:hypothetical protein